MALDIDRLLSEISPDEPCGPDLSYDTEYFALMRAAEGTPAQQIGDAVKEGEEPDWRQVKNGSIELLARSKDLNVVMLLLAALICNDGMTGLADGLSLLKALLERHWDGFHPRIDPEEKDDPFLERMNIIASLAAAPGATGDVKRYQANIRLAPLCKSRQLGSFCFRDVLIARGDLSAPASMAAPPTMNVIEGAFAETEAADLLAIGQAASDAKTLALAIDSWITEKVGAQNAPDLASFLDLLKQIDRFMQEQLAKRGYGAAPGDESAADSGSPGESGSSEANDPIRGAVRGTSDVIMLIGKICEYYQKYEPSSPVPILLRRAERLVGKSFVDAVRDLSPDALSQLKVVAGVETFNEQ